MVYENLAYGDASLKVEFRQDSMPQNHSSYLHWHQQPELLYITHGKVRIFGNHAPQEYSAGEIAIINSNDLHMIEGVEKTNTYYCLIPDQSICDIGKMPVRSSSEEAKAIYLNIVLELTKQSYNYQEMVNGYLKVLQALLSREIPEHSISLIPSRKSELIKKVIKYLNTNFHKNISLNDISVAINHDKYYLSHIVKEYTGRTIISHLNLIRCNNAYAMLSTGMHTVEQVAYANGFTNLSYFSKTYKTIRGNSPSEDIPIKKDNRTEEI